MDHRERIATELGAGGLPRGSVALVHSSLRSLGRVEGGAETVILALRDALGPEGTLLLPALSYALVNAGNPRFDVIATPSNVGAIPEAFRRMDGVIRSVHPTHSVCGIGPRAAVILGSHEQDSTPCGPHSPFRLLAEHDGLIVMLGCGLRPNTSMHGIEEIAGVPYVLGPELEITVTRRDGSTYGRRYRMHGFHMHGYDQCYDRVATLGAGPWLRAIRVMDATVHLIDAAELRRRALAALAADPYCFVEPGRKP